MSLVRTAHGDYIIQNIADNINCKLFNADNHHHAFFDDLMIVA
jgi:hypothetical protein